MFVAGSFYGCISLAQAVGEALSKFVAEKNKVRLRKDYGTRVARLREAGVISSACKTAFQSLHGKDRDDYHHLNKNVEQDCRKLEARAEGCLAALHSIESEVFQFERKERAILPRFPQYWPKSGPHLSVYLKCT